VHRPTFDAYPTELQDAFRDAAREAVTFQRQLAVEEDEAARRAVIDAGGEIATLDAREHEAFVQAVQPLHGQAQTQHPEVLKAALTRN
jgi:TRAP-type C4-dicarboxylate transport system substrate-binding protein